MKTAPRSGRPSALRPAQPPATCMLSAESSQAEVGRRQNTRWDARPQPQTQVRMGRDRSS